MTNGSRTGSAVARGGTLSLSVGIVSWMMFRAGSGCSDGVGVVVEATAGSVVPPVIAPAPSPADRSGPRERGTEGFGASKAAAGTGTRALLRSSEPAPSGTSRAPGARGNDEPAPDQRAPP